MVMGIRQKKLLMQSSNLNIDMNFQNNRVGSPEKHLLGLITGSMARNYNAIKLSQFYVLYTTKL